MVYVTVRVVVGIIRGKLGKKATSMIETFIFYYNQMIKYKAFYPVLKILMLNMGKKTFLCNDSIPIFFSFAFFGRKWQPGLYPMIFNP
jgi:hypothetical protein